MPEKQDPCKLCGYKGDLLSHGLMSCSNKSCCMHLYPIPQQAWELLMDNQPEITGKII